MRGILCSALCLAIGLPAASALAADPPATKQPPAKQPATKAPATAAAAPKLDPNLPYQAEQRNPINYDVDFSVIVTPPYKCKVLKVWLPMPQTDAGQEVSPGKLSSFPIEVKPQVNVEPLHGNKFAYFEFANPEGAQIIRHQFKVKVWELHWNLDPDKVTNTQQWPESFDKYLTSDKAVVVNDDVQGLLRKIVPEPKNPAEDMKTVIKWVSNEMKYTHTGASLKGSSQHAIAKREGHCSDYHGLCSAFGRALNYPARITYGINPYPKNSPSHCKLEAFLPPYGWVSFDVSETQQLNAKIQKDEKLSETEKSKLVNAVNDRTFRGFRDNTWYLQTRGSGYDLAPAAKEKVNVVRTAYIEADGVAFEEPDPADTTRQAHTWMTVHKYTADKPVKNPYKEVSTVQQK